MMRLIGGATVVAVGVMLAPVAAQAQAQTPGLVNARVEISAAVAGSSATLEAIERQANARDRVRQQEIAALQAELEGARTQGAAEVARLEAALIEAREALVADLAARDRAYAEEIAVFRREVTDIASTPEGAAALARYNAGDREGAVAVLVSLRQARDAARQTRIDIESAADARQIATLAMDARGKSDPAFDTGAVIVFYEEVVRLDPGEYGDWFQLVQLYTAAGRRADALAAAERLEGLAANDLDRSSAFDFRADLLLSQGDLDGAQDFYQRSLEIRERLSLADPASADLERYVSVSLDRVGDVLLRKGDQEGAWRLFQRGLQIRERLFSQVAPDVPKGIYYPLPVEIVELISGDDPAPANRLRDLSRSLDRLGDVLKIQRIVNSYYLYSLEIKKHLSMADPTSVVLARDVSIHLDRYGDQISEFYSIGAQFSIFAQSLENLERLSAADPTSAVLAKDVGAALERMGDHHWQYLYRSQQDVARSFYWRSLEILERLSAADPASSEVASELSVLLTKIGFVLERHRDRDGALELHRRSLVIWERLSPANPASADLARNVSLSLERIGRGLDRNGSLAVYQASLELAERLSAADPASVELARNVSILLVRIGNVLWSQGDRDGAMGLYRRSLEIIERKSLADPAYAVRERLLASPNKMRELLYVSQLDRERASDMQTSLLSIADALFDTGDQERALGLYRHCLEFAERLSAAEPTYPDTEQTVSVALERIGDVLVSQGDQDGALGFYRRSLEITERLSATFPYYDQATAVIYPMAKVGDVLVSQGNIDEGLALLRRSLEIAERLYAERLWSIDDARKVSALLNGIGDVLRDQGDSDGALGLYRRSLEHWERMSAANPTRADIAWEVSVSCWKLADFTGERGYLERALAIRRDLEARGLLAEEARPSIAELEGILAGLGTPAN